ncbi:hypothetical protein [Halolamina rubra]|uniref:hypothetical protein n=1 Tax=Halolamina rubra TaxID=1380430 RepID=UPI002AA2AA09|nr:hypothetical protein [Halolamina rubra]
MTRHTDTRTPTDRHETDSQRHDEEHAADQHTMGDVQHTNPMTGETFGDSQVFERGKVAVVDGGEADAEPDDERDEEPMGDVDHTPREDAPDAAQVYDRGVERVEEDDDAEADTEADV